MSMKAKKKIFIIFSSNMIPDTPSDNKSFKANNTFICGF